MKKTDIKVLLLLHFLLALYSVSGILSKLAASESFSSVRFILLYCGVLLVLVLYAIGWQQVIKYMPLTKAYANKAVCTIWGCVWGVLFFGESLNLGKLMGIVLIIMGIVLFATEEQEHE